MNRLTIPCALDNALIQEPGILCLRSVQEPLVFRR